MTLQQQQQQQQQQQHRHHHHKQQQQETNEPQTSQDSQTPAGVWSEIKLTKFNKLKFNEVVDSVRLPPIAGDDLPAHFNSNGNGAKSLSTNDLDQVAAATNSKSLLGSASVQDVALCDDDREPFQIVWRRLSFQVNEKAYDKVVGRAIKRLRGFWRCKEATSSSSSDLEIATSQKAPDSDLNKSGKRVIFENLNGYIKSGEISAILGPSGAGKTTLLNAICGRVENYRGSMHLIGGGKRRMRMSIIPQKDYLIENLTVRENLQYASRILNTASGFDHSTNISRVVDMLNLTRCLGSSVANISGGEYKRVSIAQELLKQPDILVLDEPTSGLDSMNCKNLIKSLVQLIQASREGKLNPIAIVMTIHQPDVDIFQMFDHVYCMARRGRVIFDGHPSQVLQVIKRHADFGANQMPAALKSLPTSTVDDNHEAHHQEEDQQFMIGINPANLLIEIASENIFGQEPIDKLAKYQCKQFEQLMVVHDIPLYPASYKQQQNGTTTTNNNHNHKLLLSANTAECNKSFVINENILMASAATNGGQIDSTTTTTTNGQQIKSKSLISFVAATDDNKHQPQLEIGDGERSTTTYPSSATSTLSTGHGFPTRDTFKNRNSLVRDKRLNAKNDHTGQFWYHTGLLARRAFTSTIRDPLMTMISLIFHLTIPFVMWTVYSQKIGAVKACPVIQRDVEMLSLVTNKTMGVMEDLQDQLMTALECSTMFFLSTYSFSMCSLSMAALAFPLSMHVLLKEVRNGWYSLPSFVVAKTIANFPFEVMYPVISVVMIYLMLGMPSSYMEWRLCAMALVMALISMISHTKGLVFGALSMDSVQTSIFLASSSTLPLTLLSGFTARIKNMPEILQKLSWFSLYRYSSDSINIIRFGYGTCPCDESTGDYLADKRPTFTDMPSQAVPLLSYYLTTYPDQTDTATTTATAIANQTLASVINGTISAVENATSLFIPKQIPGISNEFTLDSVTRKQIIEKIESREVDLFGQIADMVTRSFSYGRQINTCDSVRSQILMTAGAPTDDYLPYLFGGMFGLLVAAKLILFVIVKYKIGSRI